MKIVGVDPGVRNLGFAVFEDKEFITSGVITTGERSYVELFLRFSLLLYYHHPGMVVVEGAFQRSRFANPHIEAIALIKTVTEAMNINTHTYAPSSWKKILLSNGWAKKEEVREFIKSLGYEVKSQHEADAICLALTYLKEEKENVCYGRR